MSHVSRVFFANKNTQDMTRRHIFGALAEAHYISDTSMDSILIIKGIGEFQPFPKDTYMFVHMCAVMHACLIMGLLRSVGSVKSQVSCAQYRLFYRALLQKRPII